MNGIGASVESHVNDGQVGVELEAYRSALMAFFLRRVRNRWEAEDLTQEVFLRLSRRVPTEQLVSVEAFIFTVAANLWKNRTRDLAARGPHESIDDAPGEQSSDTDGVLGQTLVENRAPERVLQGKETLAEVVSALNELGERTREVFLLYRVEEMRQRAIADIFGISVSAVEKHIVKAYAHLARRLVQP